MMWKRNADVLKNRVVLFADYSFRMLNFMVSRQIIGVSGVPPLMIQFVAVVI